MVLFAGYRRFDRESAFDLDHESSQGGTLYGRVRVGQLFTDSGKPVRDFGSLQPERFSLVRSRRAG